MAKVTKDILLAGKLNEIKTFFTNLRKRFGIREIVVDDVISFNRCIIRKDNEGSVSVEIGAYLRHTRYTELAEDRRKQHTMTVNENELQAFSELCGVLVWLGSAVMPHAAFFASHLQ